MPAVGENYGRLTVLERLDMSKRSRWLVLCECGTVKEVPGETLRSGASRSCGCLRSELVSAKNRTHGQSHTKLYRVWQSMKDRCELPTSAAYSNYGGRGIRVCKRWQEFTNFELDMGPKPDGASLERKDNEKGYDPLNCVWATRHEQSRNTRRNLNLTYLGKTQVLKDWAIELKLPYGMLLYRIQVRKMPPERAFTEPSRKSKRK